MAPDERDPREAALKALGTKRHNETFAGYSRRYLNFGEVLGGAYETPWVSPITQWAGNVDSQLVIVGNHWAAESWRGLEALDQLVFERGYSNRARTDPVLIQMLRSAFGRRYDDIFMTNVFPFIAPAEGNPPDCDYDIAFRGHCRPQLGILSPSFVVCLGKPAYETVMRNLQPGRVAGGVGDHFSSAVGEIYHQHHPAELGRAIPRMPDEWQRMRAVFDAWAGHVTEPPPAQAPNSPEVRIGVRFRTSPEPTGRRARPVHATGSDIYAANVPGHQLQGVCPGHNHTGVGPVLCGRRTRWNLCDPCNATRNERLTGVRSQRLMTPAQRAAVRALNNWCYAEVAAGRMADWSRNLS